MQEFNAAFFGSLERVFLLYKEKHGKNAALSFMQELFSHRLKEGYDSLGFKKGNLGDFGRVVRENDMQLGLKVEIYLFDDKVTYRFLDDPFPGLKGTLDHASCDSMYMDFKVNYLLGKKWFYTTTKHVWKGDGLTEHVIEKKESE